MTLASHTTNAMKIAKNSIVKIRSGQVIGPTAFLYFLQFSSAVALSIGVGKDLAADFTASQIRYPIRAKAIKSHVSDDPKKYHIINPFFCCKNNNNF